MLKTIKALLFNLLGKERYLFLVSKLYFAAYHRGWLRSNPEYECHYYIRKLVDTGDVVIDIGANLGYYSVLFSDLVGPEGQVYSVEPVPIFRAVLLRNLGGRHNVQVLPYALGEEAGTATMGIPAGDQPYRHGLTRVLSDTESRAAGNTYEVEIRPAATLFAGLERLDYIKCDVEGYEHHVLPGLQALIERFRPVVQVEVSGSNRRFIFDLFSGLNYQAFFVKGQQLQSFAGPEDPTFGDWILMPEGEEGTVMGGHERS